jgi:ParB family chromosome partitioning protein
MAKLNAAAAGFNAGAVQVSKMLKISDIKIDPELSKVFTIQDKILEEIKSKMEKSGYDKSQPVVVWKGKNILLDGHTRLAAARALKLAEIPAAEMEFESFEEAALYTFERQVMRRNLTPAEILKAATMMKSKTVKDGTGRAADNLAKRLGVSPSTIYQARKIMAEAPEEDIIAVQKNEETITAAYNKIRGTKKIGPSTTEESQWLPEKIKILKGVTVLLAEAKELKAANLVIAHFLIKKEREGFYHVLPEHVRNSLGL